MSASLEQQTKLPDHRISRFGNGVAGQVFRFDTGPFNWYVIEEAGRLTLVDAGFPGHYRTFLAGLASIGRSVTDLEAIILTHAHADHMGFIERLRRETAVPVYVHADDERAAKRPLQLPWSTLLSNAWHPYVAGMLSHAALNGIFLMPGIAAVHPLRNGTRLDVPGRPEVVHTPGHTAGQITLILPRLEIVLAGDTLITRDLLRGTHGDPQLSAEGLNQDFHSGERALDRIAGLGAVTLLTGHGRAWTGDMADAVRLARDDCRRKLRKSAAI